jgi:hypothetical protein
MAIKIAGTTVIDDDRILYNIQAFGAPGIRVAGFLNQAPAFATPQDGFGIQRIFCTGGNYFTSNVNSNCTFEFLDVPSDGPIQGLGPYVYSFTLEVNHTAGSITWPTNVRWPYNVAPSLTTSKTHIFVFVTDNAGVTWRGASLLNYNQ